MKSLDQLVKGNRRIRVAGFDDAPFSRRRGSPVNVAGIICADGEFEGMLWGTAAKDGDDATDCLIAMLTNSRFYDQVGVVLTDGVAIGGFNVIDLPRLCESVQRPCIAVMRKHPDLQAIDKALRNFDDYERRRGLIRAAGTIFNNDFCHYQVAGCDPETASKALERLTTKGRVPEALRLAHIIGSAVMTGESGRRA
ncbi:uncharacterized conserved protein [Hahella chejuensis KCTC 2396]|uniref:Uncharacterized conserved protein n=1 Tax=Hahella chejuensis (strain KCTC 2396) TaxID=349521 RepID=Q2SE76_HAHCH|nr:DUF99 family protein [Hahella chejuensis]ABC31048.1 uncharacterized conserved protein [Hahella chejuensis KCTC 2396]